ncbi:MAG TPA: gephyrin-like molybdotransferase Glp [Terracidiphilus sp.]|nr:gephyrin-like molybdotransferase Glp [Terracidiphilus sp.]
MSSALRSFEEAAAMVTSRARELSRTTPAIEQLDLAAVRDRVLAKPIVADADQPAFARSTRDGFAVRAHEFSENTWLPIAGVTRAGERPAGPLPTNAVWEIMTGAPLPAGADAVAMIEHVERDGGRVRMVSTRTIKPGENFVERGAQARRGEELLAAGTILGPAQIALAASCGYGTTEVYERPRVAILTTGDELVHVESIPGPGQIRNSNAPMLESLVEGTGGDFWMGLTATDTAESLNTALAVAMESDMLLISGGVSAGKFDLVEPALERLGARFHFTGVRMQPGKPLVFGELSREGQQRPLPFFGLPGNPISSAVTFLLFAAPMLEALAGCRELGPRFAAASLSRNTDRNAKPGLTRFLPAHCNFNPEVGVPQVETVPWNGSGDLPAFARSNCFVVIPEDASSLEAGTIVRILRI